MSLLWRRDFLHVDTGYGIPASERVSGTVETITITDPESYFHLPLGDLLAHSFNLTNTVQIFYGIWRCIRSHIHYTINGQGCATLGVIKLEVPALTAIVAVKYTKIAIEEDTQTSII